MTYRIWLLRIYGNMGSAILVNAPNESEAKAQAKQVGYSDNQIDKVECLSRSQNENKTN